MRIWKLYKIIFGIVLFFAIERFCRYQTGGFRLSKVSALHDYAFQPASPEIPSEIRSLLQQSFTFLGRGVQFFAFLGDDQKTVLKLFKHHHTGIPIDFIEKWFPHILQMHLIQKRERRMLRLFKSAYIAYTLLPQETGVFFCHLRKEKEASLTVVLKDKLGTLFSIDLAKTEFVMQKKAITVEKKLSTLLQENKVDETIQAIKKLLFIIEEHSRKGVKNKDGKILQNYGFVDSDAIEIDIGSYTYHTYPTYLKPRLSASQKAKKKLLNWIQKYYATSYDQIKKELDLQELK